MQPVKIKINPANQKQPASPHLITLNSSSAKKLSSPKKLGRIFWLLLTLVILEAAALIALYLTRPALPFGNIIPTSTVAISYFNHPALTELLISLKDRQYDWPPFNWGRENIAKFLSDNQLGSIQEILRLFGDQMALVILPATPDKSTPNWLLLASVNNASAMASAQGKIENNLKQNYNLVAENYRQITITQVKTLQSGTNTIYYAQAKNYFILTNDPATLKDVLDKIVGR